MIDQLARFIAPLSRRVRGMVARGVLTLVEDAGGVQRVQAKVGAQTLDGLDRPQMYGFSSHPPAGGEVVVVFVGGNRDHGVIVGEGDRAHRPQASQPGSVVVYDGAGHSVTLSPGGIAIHGGGHNLVITGCPKITQQGDIEATGDVKAGSISLLHHKHPDPQGGDVGEPK
jgi:phage gp45-like